MRFVLQDSLADIRVEFGKRASYPYRVAHMSPTCVPLETVLEELPEPNSCEPTWRQLRHLDLESISPGEPIPFDNQAFMLERASADTVRIAEIRGKYYRGDPPEEVCVILLRELTSIFEEWLRFLEGGEPTRTSVTVLRGTVLHDPPLRWTVNKAGTVTSLGEQEL